MRRMGLEKGDHVALISKNCAHWIISDIALMMSGYVSVPLYASLAADQLALVLEKSDAKGVIVGKLDEWEKKSKGLIDGIKVMRFHIMKECGSNARNCMEELMKNEPMEGYPEPDIESLWTILFTSGTTGTPKGVMHTYKNAALLNNNEKINNIMGTLASGQDTRLFSFLPLNHIAERAAIELSGIGSGGTISFADTLDTFAKNLAETRPTFLFCST